MHKILCYGDSNTYGYDPRGFLGMRYPEAVRWTTILADRLNDDYKILEEGMNGRPLPRLPREKNFLDSITGHLTKDDLLITMLGTNDILLTAYPDANVPVQRMEGLLQWYENGSFPFRLMILCPVNIADRNEELSSYHEESRRMNAGFEALCEKYSVFCYNAADWNIPLSYDGVHFSEDGHRIFAEHLAGILMDIFKY